MNKGRRNDLVLIFGIIGTLLVILAVFVTRLATLNQIDSSRRYTPQSEYDYTQRSNDAHMTMVGDVSVQDSQEITAATDALAAKVETLESHINTLADGQHSSDDVEEMLSPETLEAEAEAEGEQWATEAELIEHTFQSEAVNGDWTASAEERLAKVVDENQVAGVSLIDVDCRDTICRADVEFEPNSVHDVVMMLQQSIHWPGETLIRIEDIESGQGIVYLGHEDFPLPTQFN